MLLGLQILFELLFFLYILYVSLYDFILSVSGLSCNHRSKLESKSESTFTILIPAYQEDNVILHTVRQNLMVEYPKEKYRIVVISDSMKEETIEQLQTFAVHVHKVDFMESTKVKAINSALSNPGIESDMLVILDADNIMKGSFLSNADHYVNQGQLLIQGRRKIKNPTNDLSILDDISEQINNHINRKGVCKLGGSASIAGSGFVVDYNLGKKVFSKLDSIGGFDKEFEIYALERGMKTNYHESLVIFDEKVESAKVFENQRRRWISSQLFFIKKYFAKGLKGLLEGDMVLFNSIILRNAKLPRVLNLGIFSVLIVFVLSFQQHILIPQVIWLVFYIMFVCSLPIAIPKRYYNKKMWRVVVQIPLIFFKMLVILFRLNGANKDFIHTPHQSNAFIENE